MRQLADDQLLDELGAALRMEFEPSDEEVAALRALVGRADRNGKAFAAGVRPYRRRMLVAATLAATMVIGGSAVALATGAPLPSVLRAPARALGLPVDSAALAGAKAALSELSAALTGPDDARIARAADQVALRFRLLGESDRHAIQGEVEVLLRQAEDRLVARPPFASPAANPASSPSDGTLPSAAPTSFETADPRHAPDAPEDGTAPSRDDSEDDSPSPVTTSTLPIESTKPSSDETDSEKPSSEAPSEQSTAEDNPETSTSNP